MRTTPEFPSNRVLLDSEIPCSVCGSGPRAHMKGWPPTRDHEYARPPRSAWWGILLFALGACSSAIFLLLAIGGCR